MMLNVFFCPVASLEIYEDHVSSYFSFQNRFFIAQKLGKNLKTQLLNTFADTIQSKTTLIGECGMHPNIALREEAKRKVFNGDP